MKGREEEKDMRKRNQEGFSLIELLIVMMIILVLSALAIPGFQAIQRSLRISGDSRNVFSSTSQAKMKAAAEFTHARARMSLTNRTYQIEKWDKTLNSWQVVNGTQYFSTGVGAGFGAVAAAPPQTQVAIQQAPVCRSNSPLVSPANLDASGDVCIEFNSRGIPVDNSNSPTGNDALYITDGNTVFGVTVNAAGLMQSWSIGINEAQWTRR